MTKIRWIFFSLLVLFAVALAPGVALAQSNSFSNSSFEDLPLGWSAGGFGFTPTRSDVYAYEGSYSLFGSCFSGCYFYQVLDLPAADYELSVYARRADGGAVGPSMIQPWVDGIYPLGSCVLASSPWYLCSYTFSFAASLVGFQVNDFQSLYFDSASLVCSSCVSSYSYPGSVSSVVQEVSLISAVILPDWATQVFIALSIALFFFFLVVRRSLRVGGR